MLAWTLPLAVAALLTASAAAVGEAPPKFNPPKQHYLALGDSLTFGFRFDIFNQHFPDVPPELFHGYVDDLSHMLQRIQPSIRTINFGCVGETTDTFIDGGCLYTQQGFELHDA